MINKNNLKQNNISLKEIEHRLTKLEIQYKYLSRLDYINMIMILITMGKIFGLY